MSDLPRPVQYDTALRVRSDRPDPPPPKIRNKKIEKGSVIDIVERRLQDPEVRCGSAEIEGIKRETCCYPYRCCSRYIPPWGLNNNKQDGSPLSRASRRGGSGDRSRVLGGRCSWLVVPGGRGRGRLPVPLDGPAPARSTRPGASRSPTQPGRVRRARPSATRASTRA